MEGHEEIVMEEITENTEELTAEETVEGVTDTAEEETPVKMYTEEELNKRLDEILPGKIERAKAKIRREFEEEYAPYKEAESVLNAGMGTSNITDATAKMREYYQKKGLAIPERQMPAYNAEDMRVLADNEAQKIIEDGFDEVVEETERLAAKGVDKMTPREKLVFSRLSEYREAEGSRQELLKIGVKSEVIDSKEFKDFAKMFDAKTPITRVYEMYSKTQKPITKTEKIGSLKNQNAQEDKVIYTPEEVDRLTQKDLDDPVIFERVRRSMKTWK